MFFISKEDQEQVHNRFNSIRKLANELINLGRKTIK